ncbi:response regulator transcription factor [Trueperella abortisuis]|uniref:DNA-binding response OmpR family regulator n=1 Tax=Trueperella abortisuis TaxID=445930 RepID=A0ABT9PJ16_9ACTO|nr:response regulator transcription factor [Trueperella abortisuis]MDP9832155.1 DNA-binding response OmpR family regulator [Trueperella abortisuis]
MITPRVLVVDDEAQMLAIVTFALETKGFTCVTASTAAEAWSKLITYDFHLAILDIMLPHGSGLDLTRRIRAQIGDLPIILLTARSDVEDRIKGLEAGADDYLTKPFSPQELALRAQALLRRSFPEDDARESMGDLAVNMDFLEATWRGRKLNISATEVRLLATLIRHDGEVVTHRQLLNEAWGVTEQAGGREMIKTAIYRVRKTLEKAEVGVVIRSHRAEGYSLALES